jgi:hypothetical protein
MIKPDEVFYQYTDPPKPRRGGPEALARFSYHGELYGNGGPACGASGFIMSGAVPPVAPQAASTEKKGNCKQSRWAHRASYAVNTRARELFR